MKELLKRLLHAHKWENVTAKEVQMYYNGREDGTQYIFIKECTICGKMRMYKFRD